MRELAIEILKEYIPIEPNEYTEEQIERVESLIIDYLEAKHEGGD